MTQKLVPYKPKRKPKPAPAPATLVEEVRVSPGALPIVASDPRRDRSVGRTVELSTGRIHVSPVTAYLVGKLAPGPSRETMRTGLKDVARLLATRGVGTGDYETLPWWTLTYAHTSWVKDELSKRYKRPETANQKLFAMIGVLRKCAQIEDQNGVPLMTFDACERAIPDTVRGKTIPKGRALERYELDALFGACSGPLETRDKALLALLFGCGLRVSELATAEFVGYVEGVLRVTGKRNEERDVPVPPFARKHIETWVASRGTEPGPLLHAFRGPKIGHQGMTTNAMRERLKELAKIAGVEKFTPHDLRRSYISKMLDDVDPLTVAKLVGHKSIQTTMGYDMRGERAKKAAAEKFEGPE